MSFPFICKVRAIRHEHTRQINSLAAQQIALEEEAKKKFVEPILVAYRVERIRLKVDEVIGVAIQDAMDIIRKVIAAEKTSAPIQKNQSLLAIEAYYNSMVPPNDPKYLLSNSLWTLNPRLNSHAPVVLAGRNSEGCMFGMRKSVRKVMDPKEREEKKERERKEKEEREEKKRQKQLQAAKKEEEKREMKEKRKREREEKKAVAESNAKRRKKSDSQEQKEQKITSSKKGRNSLQISQMEGAVVNDSHIEARVNYGFAKENERDLFLWNEDEDRLFDPIEMNLFEVEMDGMGGHVMDNDIQLPQHKGTEFHENSGIENERNYSFDLDILPNVANGKEEICFGDEIKTFGDKEDDEIGWIEGIEFDSARMFSPFSPRYSPFCGPNEFDERLEW